MHRVALATHRGRAREQDRLVLALRLGEHVVDGLVVEQRVVVVHHLRVRAVEVLHALSGDALAEVGLEAVDAHRHELFEVALVPGSGIRVREVDDRHAGLPLVPLPHRAVGVPDEVAQLRALFEQRRLLADVRVDPHAHLQPAVMQLREQAFGVGELRLVPLEIAPFELLHPTAVEVEHRKRDVTLGHAVDEVEHGLLVVVGGKARAQPQAVAPVRHERRAAGERGVVREDLLHIGAADHRIGHLLSGHAELHARDLFGADLELHLARLVHEQAVVVVGQVERHVLVRLLGAGAAVLVPDLDALAVLDEVRETLAQAVDLLADAQVELVGHMQPAVRARHKALGAPAGVRNALAVIQVCEVDRLAFGDAQRQAPRGEGPRVVGLVDLDVRGRLVEMELRAVLAVGAEVDQTRGDDVFARARHLDREDAAVERHARIVNRRAERAEQRELARLDVRGVDVGRVLHGVAVLDKPAAIEELHGSLLLGVLWVVWCAY